MELVSKVRITAIEEIDVLTRADAKNEAAPLDRLLNKLPDYEHDNVHIYNPDFRVSYDRLKELLGHIRTVIDELGYPAYDLSEMLFEMEDNNLGVFYDGVVECWGLDECIENCDKIRSLDLYDNHDMLDDYFVEDFIEILELRDEYQTFLDAVADCCTCLSFYTAVEIMPKSNLCIIGMSVFKVFHGYDNYFCIKNLSENKNCSSENNCRHIVEAEITCIGITPEEKFIVTGHADGKCLVWDTADWSLLSKCENESCVHRIDFSQDLECFVAYTDKYVCVWNVRTGEKIKAMRHNAQSSIFSEWNLLPQGSNDRIYDRLVGISVSDDNQWIVTTHGNNCTVRKFEDL